MYEDDSGAVDDCGFLLSDAIEGGIFLYLPRPEYFQHIIAPRYFECVVFATGWDRVRVQAAKIIYAKHK